LDDRIGDVKSSVAMRRIEEELSGHISKTGTIIDRVIFFAIRTQTFLTD
jgi:hypothetical protein